MRQRRKGSQRRKDGRRRVGKRRGEALELTDLLFIIIIIIFCYRAGFDILSLCVFHFHFHKTDFCMKLLNYRMKVKPTRGRRRIQMLHNLANGSVAVRRAAEDREVWRYSERMSKTCCTAENYRLTAPDDVEFTA